MSKSFITLIASLFFSYFLSSQTLIINSGNTIDAEDSINIRFQLDSIVKKNIFPEDELSSEPITVRFEKVETLTYIPQENNNENPYKYQTKEYNFQDKSIVLSNLEDTFIYSFESNQNFLEYFDTPPGEKIISIIISLEFPNPNFFNNDFFDTNSEQYVGVINTASEFTIFFKEGINENLYSNVFTISNNIINSNINTLVSESTNNINIVVREDCGSESDNCDRWLANAKKNLSHPIISDFTGDGVNDIVARVYYLYLGDIDWQLTDDEKELYFSRWVLFKGEEFGKNEVEYSFHSSYDQINEAIIPYSKDLDGDGDLDIYTVPDVYHGYETNKPEDWSGNVLLYLNDGNGNFTSFDEEVSFPSKGVIGQLDSDSDIESISSSSSKYDSRYLRLGEDSSVIQFFDKIDDIYTITSSPEIYIEPKAGSEIFSRKVVDLKLYDFNNDGYNDVIFWLSQQEMQEGNFDDEGNFVGDISSTSLQELGFTSDNYFVILRGSDTGFDFSNIDLSNDILYKYSSNSYEEHYSFDILEQSNGKDVLFFMDIFSAGQYEDFYDDAYQGPMSKLFALEIDGENLTDITNSFFQDYSNINYRFSSNEPEFIDFNNDGLLDIHFFGGWATKANETKSFFLLNKSTHFENVVVSYSNSNEYVVGDFNNDGYIDLYQSVSNDLKFATDIQVIRENGKKRVDHDDASPVILNLNLDTTIPEITLLGESTINIQVGSTYTEPGATAFDNYDGDITDRIEILSNVDTDIIGEYSVIYNVKDANENAAISKTRIVNVVSSLTNEKNIKEKFNIYPNPTLRFWKITSSVLLESVEIFDLIGRKVYSKNPMNEHFELDASFLPSGVYTMIINKQKISRLVKN